MPTNNGVLAAFDLGLPATLGARPPSSVDAGLGGLRVPTTPLDPTRTAMPSPEEAGQMMRARSQQVLAPQPAPAMPAASMYFSPSTGDIFVNGMRFNQNDADSGLRSRDLASGPPSGQRPPSDVQDWRPLGQDEYNQYIDSILNPSLGRLAERNLDAGGRGLSRLYDYAQVYTGINREGALNHLDTLDEQDRMNAPYMRRVGDIEDAGDALEWVVASGAQAVPSLIEAMAYTLGGAAAGSAIGPAGAAGGAIEGLFAGTAGRAAAREAIQQGIASYARNRVAGQGFRATVERVAAAEGTQAAERVVLAREASSRLGAVLASGSHNLAVGTADSYGEMLEQGVDPDAPGARARAAAFGVPYSLLETIPDLLIYGAITRSLPRATRNVGLNIGAYALGGAAVEGVAEGGQEMLTTGAASSQTGSDWNTEENRSRWLEAAAAGAVPGFFLGGAGGLTAQPSQDSAPGPAPMLALPHSGVIYAGPPADMPTLPHVPTGNPSQWSPTSPTDQPPFPLAEQPNLPFNDIPQVQPPLSAEEAFLQSGAPVSPDRTDDALRGNPGTEAVSDEAKTVAAVYSRMNPLQRANFVRFMRSEDRQAREMRARGAFALVEPLINTTPAEKPNPGNRAASRARPLPVNPQQELPMNIPHVATPEGGGMTALTQEEQPNVTTEQGSAEVPTTPPAGNSERVGEQNKQSAQAAGSRGQNLKKGSNFQEASDKLDQTRPEPLSSKAKIDAATEASPRQRLTKSQRKAATAAKLKASTKLSEQEADELTSLEHKVASGLSDVQHNRRNELRKKAGLPTQTKDELAADVEASKQFATKTEKAKPDNETKQENKQEKPANKTKQKDKEEGDDLLRAARQKSATVKEEPWMGKLFSRMKKNKNGNINIGHLNTKAYGVHPDTGAALTDAEKEAFRQYNAGVKAGKISRPVVTPSDTNNTATAEERREKSRDDAGLLELSQLVSRAASAAISARTLSKDEATQRSIAASQLVVDKLTELADKNGADFMEYWARNHLTPSGELSEWKGVNRQIIELAIKIVTDLRATKLHTTPEKSTKPFVRADVEKFNKFLDKTLNKFKSNIPTIVVKNLAEFKEEFPDIYESAKASFKGAFDIEVGGHKNNPLSREDKQRFRTLNLEYYDTDGKFVTDETGSAETKRFEYARLVHRFEYEAAYGAWGRQRGAPAFVHNGKLIFFTDNLEAGTESQVLFHELSHLGLRALFNVAMSSKERAALGLDQMRAHVAKVFKENPRPWEKSAVRDLTDLEVFLEWAYSVSNQVQVWADSYIASGTSRYAAIEEAVMNSAPIAEPTFWNRVVRFLQDLWKFIVGEDLEIGEEHIATIMQKAGDFLRSGDTTSRMSTEFFRNKIANDISEYNGYVRFMTTVPADPDEISQAEKEKQERLDAATTVLRHAQTDAYNIPQSRGRKFLEQLKDSTVPGAKDMLRDGLNWLNTLDDFALKSMGVRKLYDILVSMEGVKNSLLRAARDMRPLTYKRKELGARDGVDEAQLLKAGEMLGVATQHKMHLATEAAVRKAPDFVIITPEGATYDEAKIEQLFKMGLPTPKEFVDGLNTYVAGIETGKVKFNGVTADSPEYKLVEENLRAMAMIHVESALAAANASSRAKRTAINTIFTRLTSQQPAGARALSEADREWFRQVMDVYTRFYFKEGADSDTRKFAEQFLVQVLRTLHSPEALSDFTAANKVFDPEKVEAGKDKKVGNSEYVASVVRELRDPKVRAILRHMPAMASLQVSSKSQIDMLKYFGDVVVQEASAREAQDKAKRSIIGAYAPLRRNGKFQIRMVAKTADGHGVKLARDFALPYFQADDVADAKSISTDLNKIFGGRTWAVYNDIGERVEVKLSSVYEASPAGAKLAMGGDLDSFMRISQALGISLTPEERESVVVAFTNLEARARKSLERTGNVGWDKDVIGGINEFIDIQARVISKSGLVDEIENTWIDDTNWMGDESYLEKLKADFEAAKTTNNPATILQAEQELLRYARMYSEMAPMNPDLPKFTVPSRDAKGVTFTKKGRGQKYKDYAQRLVLFMRSAADPSLSTEDLVSKEFGVVSVGTVMLQLGGNVASALVNLSSLPMTLYPYLATYNKRTGFGLGFGDAAAAQAVFSAMPKMSDPKLSDAVYLRKLLTTGQWGKHGLDRASLIMLLEETEKGELQAAYQLSLSGSSFNQISSTRFQGAVEKWMWMFSHAEMYLRRVSALSTYKLLRDRAIKSGADPDAFLDPKSDAYQRVISEVTQAIHKTQGKYAMYNRPAAYRGNIVQHIMKYKMYPTMVVQLMAHLPTEAKVRFLVLMLLMAGVKGIPFADDIFDIIDFIMQKFGIRQASIETAIAEFADTMIPGASPYVLHGVLDKVFGATISSRVGMGDLIPFTGVGREGADLGRELEGALGPVWGAASNSFEYALMLGDTGLQFAGVKPRTTTVGDLISNMPVAGLRAPGEAILQGMDGTITNSRGQVVSNDVTALTMATRALGFYPNAASEQNNLVRLARYHDNYVAAVKARFVQSYAQARRRGDERAMQDIRTQVQEWNAAARAAGQEDYVIQNFMAATLRAGRANEQEAVERYRQAAPKYSNLEVLERLFGTSP